MTTQSSQPTPPSPGGLGERIWNTLAGGFWTAIVMAISPVGDALRNGTVALLDRAESQLVETFEPLLVYVRDVPGQPAFIKDQINRILARRHFAIVAPIIAFIGGVLISIVMVPVQTSMSFVQYAVNRLVRASRLDAQSVVTAELRGLTWSQSGSDELADQGISDDRQQVMRGLARQLLSAEQLSESVRRGYISRESMYTTLRSQGYDDTDANTIIRLIYALADANVVVQLYNRRLISEEDCLARLNILGLDTDNARDVIAANRPLLAADQIAAAEIRGLVDTETAAREIQRTGLSDSQISIVRETAYSTLDYESIRQAFLRGELSETDARVRLMRLGMRPEDIDVTIRLFWQLPSVSDMVRFAVREVFSPEIVERFRTDEDFPEQFAQYASMAGLSREWAIAYWRAHWDLPSPQMGYDMLHRGIITRDELEVLLRTLDVMPFWRDKLMQLSFRPYTRVDVRRMYQAGVLTIDEVRQAYKDLGYDDDKAQKMTEFTVADKQTSNKDLTKTELINAYRRRLFTRDETFDALRQLGYDEEESSFYLAIADLQTESEETKDKIELIHQLFISKQITETDMIARLGELNLSSIAMQKFVEKWKLEAKRSVAKLTLAMIEEFWRKGIISDADVTRELSALGYSQQHISWIIRSFEPATEKAPKEKKLTLSDLRAMRRGGTITMQQFRAELRELGYNDEDIERQVALEEQYDAKKASKK